MITLKLLRREQGRLVPSKGAVLLFGAERIFQLKMSGSTPLNILREVVINALVHADYSQRGGPIRIAFFDDRIEVENPGILLPGMTIEDMKQGVSRIRNPVIARVFRELGLIEQWGSGVKRIFKEAEELGLPELQIIELG